MTCICKAPNTVLNRDRKGRYYGVCLACGRVGYKSNLKNAALDYWEQATEPAKFVDAEQKYPMPAGFAQHPFLYEAYEENNK